VIALSDTAAWRAALCGIAHAFAHTWEYWHALQGTHMLNGFLYTFTDRDSRFICPFAERRFRGTTDIISPPGLAGFVGSGPPFSLLLDWKATAQQRGYVCAFIGLHPALADPQWLRDWPVTEYSHAYLVDLTSTLDEIRSRMSESRRRELRKAELEGINVWIGTPAVKDFFVSTFDEAFRRRRFDAAHYLAEGSRRLLSSADGFILVGAGREQVESVTAFGATPYIADGLYNVSLSTPAPFSTLLIWSAIRELKARGIPLLNLGGGIQSDDGVARYKSYLGTFVRPLVCLKQVFDSPTFEQLCAARGAGLFQAGGYFPPYRAVDYAGDCKGDGSS
jgi:hypothetical protein